MSFTLELPSFHYGSGTSNKKEFHNLYGTWNISIFSTTHVMSGFIIFKPAGIDAKFIKQIKIKLIFENQYSSSYNYEKDAMIEGDFAFYFTPFYSSGSSNGRHEYKIDIQIQMPEIPFDDKLKGAMGHLNEIFASQKLGDVKIKTKDDEFNVHKIILVRSEVFDAMLSNPDTKESQTGEIEIDDIKHEVLYEMCRYLYTDEIPKIEKLALELLIAADKYNIPELASKCGQYLIDNMAIESFYDVIVTADRLNVNDLKETAIDYIIDNRKTIFSSDGWKNLKKNHILLAMEVSEKYMANS